MRRPVLSASRSLTVSATAPEMVVPAAPVRTALPVSRVQFALSDGSVPITSPEALVVRTSAAASVIRLLGLLAIGWLIMTGSPIVTAGSAHAQQVQPQTDAVPDAMTNPGESEVEHNLRMQWWRDARFGMFIHWGLYAIPAGQWNGEAASGTGEWIMANAAIPVEEYEPLADSFNPTAYDPAEWVRLAKQAGQEYLVITSKHHDGFSLFDSEVTDYDVVDATPYGRDLLAGLAKECKRQGVTLGFYYSIMDWHHPSQFVDPNAETRHAGYANNRIHPDQKQTYIAHMKAQLAELVERYDPAILWFDGEWVDWWTEEDGKDLYNYVRSLKHDILINNRVGKGRMGMEGLNRGPGYAGDFGTPEQQIPDTGLPGVDWESCMTMNDTWGYRADDHNWKSSTDLIRNLIDVASKGGNYLLNVGPTAEGRIPEESVRRLQEIGRWMEVNAEAIYMSQASPFAQPAWGRYTRSDPNTLYAHVFEWPDDRRLFLPVPADRVESVVMLTAEDPVEVPFGSSGAETELRLPDEPSNEHAAVLKVVLSERW